MVYLLRNSFTNVCIVFVNRYENVSHVHLDKFVRHSTLVSLLTGIVQMKIHLLLGSRKVENPFSRAKPCVVFIFVINSRDYFLSYRSV